MSLDTYREGLFLKITACRDEKHCLSLVNEADCVLRGSKIEHDDQIRFWRALKDDLDEAKHDIDRYVAPQVIEVTQAAIAQQEAMIGQGDERS